MIMQHLENLAAPGCNGYRQNIDGGRGTRNKDKFTREDILYIISSKDGEIWEEEDNKVKTFH